MISGWVHPDHDTIAYFRKAFLPEIKALFVQVLVMARHVLLFCVIAEIPITFSIAMMLSQFSS